MLAEIRSLSDGKVLWSGEVKAHNGDSRFLRGANLGGADLRGANLGGANLRGANLGGGNLRGATIPTGETWEQYLDSVVPAFLTAGGKRLEEVATEEHWNCHDWNNCPTAAAFPGCGIEAVPVLLRPRAEQFIQFFDARLIPRPVVTKDKAHVAS